MESCCLFQTVSQIYYSRLAVGSACPTQVGGITYRAVQTVGIGRSYAYSYGNASVGSLAYKVLDGTGQKIQIFVKVVYQRRDHTLVEYGPVFSHNSALG